jgi:hypothetical protein
VLRTTVIAGVVLALAVSGCGSLVPDRTAGTTSAAPIKAAPPALCRASQPARLEPFPFNRDAAGRDRMVRAVPNYVGGIAYFRDLDARTLASLIESRFIDPYDQQNLAPTTWQMFQFLCQHPRVRAMGYVVSLEREDYRMSITTVYSTGIDSALRADAEKFCVDADEVVVDGELECFWD